jgi:eukaryotic-like serine/threonine-protein kinase
MNTDSRELQPEPDPTIAHQPVAPEQHAEIETISLRGQQSQIPTDAEIAHEAIVPDTLAHIAKAGTAASTPPSNRFGDYVLIKEIARGGMGVVYQARHTKLNRVVALKMILSGGLASAEEVQRFYVEAEAAAKLDHPYIVPIYEVGELQGRHFFSMAFVEGPSLAKQLRDHPCSPPAAAELLRMIAEAVQYAHTQGVIHRDLKPANILIGAEGRPRITDFGLAKRVEDAAELTTTGQILGTPSYMAPEQAAGRIHAISPRTDVYALGAILYEMLTGRPPFRDANAWETIRQVIQSEPVTPRLLNPNVQRDLETIVLKALDKEPLSRYDSAQAFADDLGRYLRDEPILARRLSSWEKAVRWRRKNRTVATLGLVLVLLLSVSMLGFGAASAIFRSQQRAQEKLTQDKQQLEIQKQSIERSSRAERYASDMILAGDALRIATGIGRVREFVDPWADDMEEPDLRGWEWHLLRSASHEEWHTLRIQTPEGIHVPLNTVAFHPQAELIALGSSTGELFVGPLSGNQQLELASEHQSHIHGLAWRPDGMQLASSGIDGHVYLWDLNPLRKVEDFPIGKVVFAVAWSPDAKLLAAAVHEDGIHIFDTATKQRIDHLTHQVASQQAIAFSPQGDQLAVSGYIGGDYYDILLWNTKTWENFAALHGHKQQVNSIRWSRSGKQLVTASFDRTVKIWEVPERKLLHSFEQPEAQVTAALFAAKDQEVISVGWDSLLRRYNVNDGQQTYLGRGHTKRVQWCDINAAGDLIASVGDDGVVRYWDLQQPPTILERKHAAQSIDDPYPTIAWNRAGNRVAVCNNSTICIWNQNQVEPNLNEPGAWPAWSAQDRYYSAWVADVLSVKEAGKPAASLTFKSPVPGFGNCRSAWSHAESRLMISVGTQLYLWNMPAKQPVLFAEGFNSIAAMAWNPSDTEILVACVDGTVKRLRIDDGSEISSFKPHLLSHAKSVTWSPLGDRFITTSPDSTALVWNAATGEKMLTLAEHSFTVHGAAWSPDGTRIATAGGDGTVRIWRSDNGQQTLILRHPEQVLAVAWSPNGQQLASLSQDGTFLVHNASISYEDERGEGE